MFSAIYSFGVKISIETETRIQTSSFLSNKPRLRLWSFRDVQDFHPDQDMVTLDAGSFKFNGTRGSEQATFYRQDIS